MCETKPPERDSDPDAAQLKGSMSVFIFVFYDWGVNVKYEW